MTTQPPNLVLVPGTPASRLSDGTKHHRPRRRRAAELREDGAGHRGARASAGAFRQIVVHTGQHYDSRMSDEVLADLDFPDVDRFLGVGSGTHGEQTAKVLLASSRRSCSRIEPDVVVVAGDVNSTLGCALAASKLGIAVAHVEAGLRSFDWSMPEEVNRVLTDRLSDLLFTHSPEAIDNLEAEGIVAGPRPLRRQHDDRLAAPLREARARSGAPGRPSACASAASTCSSRCTGRPTSTTRRALADRRRRWSAWPRTRPVVFPIHPRTRARLGRGRRPRPPRGRRRALHRAGRLPRVPVAAGRRRRDRDRLRRRAGGGVGARRPLLHVPPEHRAPDHADPRDQRPARRRSGRDRRGPPGRLRPADAVRDPAVGRPRRRARRGRRWSPTTRCRPASRGPTRERRRPLLLVCSSGGHLLQLHELREAWDPFRAHVGDVRQVRRALAAARRARASTRSGRRTATSRTCCATCAWPGSVVRARAPGGDPDDRRRRRRAVRVDRASCMRIPVVYVESFTRIEGLSLSGRMIAPVATRMYGQWPELAAAVAAAALRRQPLRCDCHDPRHHRHQRAAVRPPRARGRRRSRLDEAVSSSTAAARSSRTARASGSSSCRFDELADRDARGARRRLPRRRRLDHARAPVRAAGPIVMPRRHDLGEAVDDHQLQLAPPAARRRPRHARRGRARPARPRSARRAAPGRRHPASSSPGRPPCPRSCAPT